MIPRLLQEPVVFIFYATNWLVFNAVLDDDPNADAEEEVSNVFNEHFPLFLAIAEDMRDFGEHLINRRSKTPLLPPENMWVVPPEFPLPRKLMVIPKLTPFEKHALETYRAPRSL